MKLLADWQDILRRAWSVRLMVISTLLSSVSVALMITGADWLGWHPAWVMALVVVTSIGAVVARLLDQGDHDGDE